MGEICDVIFLERVQVSLSELGSSKQARNSRSKQPVRFLAQLKAFSLCLRHLPSCLYKCGPGDSKAVCFLGRWKAF